MYPDDFQDKLPQIICEIGPFRIIANPIDKSGKVLIGNYIIERKLDNDALGNSCWQRIYSLSHVLEEISNENLNYFIEEFVKLKLKEKT